MPKDRLLEILERGAWLDAELVNQETSGLAVNAQRIGLTARAVESAHELPTEPLPKRVRADKSLEFPDELGMPSEPEIRFEPLFERAKAELLEAEYFCLREGFLRKIDKRRAAPKAEGLSKQACAQIRRRPACLLDEPLKAKQVELVRSDAHQVARFLRDDYVARSKRLA